MMQITKMEAIRSLDGELAFHIDPDGVVSLAAVDGKISGTIPTDFEIQAEITRLQAIHDSTQYQRDRASSYPPMSDQLDMLFWDKMNGTEIWKNNIIKIKEKFPKE
jgi:hypothetical protein